MHINRTFVSMTQYSSAYLTIARRGIVNMRAGSYMSIISCDNSPSRNALPQQNQHTRDTVLQYDSGLMAVCLTAVCEVYSLFTMTANVLCYTPLSWGQESCTSRLAQETCTYVAVSCTSFVFLHRIQRRSIVCKKLA